MMLTSIRVLGSQAPGVPHYAQRRLAVVHAQRDFMGEKRTGIVSSFATLESWQLRKLKAAFFQGRRNVSIKQLAAEVELDR